jgi:hypothetical protein
MLSEEQLAIERLYSVPIGGVQNNVGALEQYSPSQHFASPGSEVPAFIPLPLEVFMKIPPKQDSPVLHIIPVLFVFSEQFSCVFEITVKFPLLLLTLPTLS